MTLNAMTHIDLDGNLDEVGPMPAEFFQLPASLVDTRGVQMPGG
jgi:hypothetical protein